MFSRKTPAGAVSLVPASLLSDPSLFLLFHIKVPNVPPQKQTSVTVSKLRQMTRCPEMKS